MRGDERSGVVGRLRRRADVSHVRHPRPCRPRRLRGDHGGHRPRSAAAPLVEALRLPRPRRPGGEGPSRQHRPSPGRRQPAPRPRRAFRNPGRAPAQRPAQRRSELRAAVGCGDFIERDDDQRNNDRREPRRTGTASGATPPIRATYNFGFTVAYDLDLFGRLRRGIEAGARRRGRAAKPRWTSPARRWPPRPPRAYVQACAYALQADVAPPVPPARQPDTYDITVRQRDLGAGADFDVARARTLVEQTPRPGAPARSLPPLRPLQPWPCSPASRRSGTPEAAAACRTPPKLVQPLPVGDGQGLLARRPDVREAERTLAASVARIGVRTADLYPTITLRRERRRFWHGAFHAHLRARPHLRRRPDAVVELPKRGRGPRPHPPGRGHRAGLSSRLRRNGADGAA